MSGTTAQLLKAFESLPVQEKQFFTIEFLRLTRDLPIHSGDLTDEEIGETGRALSAYLDQEDDAKPE